MIEKLSSKEIIYGHILIVITSIIYSAAWILNYNMILSGAAGLIIMIALIIGMLGSGLIIFGITKLSVSKWRKFKVWYIVILCAVLYIITYNITIYGYKRELTSEIFLMFFWLVLESCSIYVLFRNRSISVIQMVITYLFTFVSIIIGVICYTIHYNLPDFERFINGLIPYFVFSLNMLIVIIFTLIQQRK